MFQKDLLTVFNNGCNDYGTFEKMYISTLNLHAPQKQKSIRANHAPFMNKKVRKALMKRNQFYNKWSKSRKQIDKERFLKQKKIAAKILKNAKKEYFHNLNDKDVLDNKKFWKIIRSAFTDKTNKRQTINLVEDGHFTTNDKEKAEIFSEFYSKVVENLDIKENCFILDKHDRPQANRIDQIIAEFKYHPSIIRIKSLESSQDCFNFGEVSTDKIHDLINSLNSKKATPFNNIPCKSLKENANVCAETLAKLINNDISNGIFPDELKLADVAPVFKVDKSKKNDPTNKKNYRPVSILPPISKIYERIMQEQMNTFHLIYAAIEKVTVHNRL